MRRTVLTLTLATAALALAACSTAPAAAPTPATPVATPAPTLAEQMLAIRKAELELERTEQMAWLKFADQSGSDMVKGFVMGRSAVKPAAASSTAQTVIAAQAQQDATALRREEMAEGRSWWNRGLQIVDRVAPLWMFYKNQSFARYQLDRADAQHRYTLDTLRGAQLDGVRLGGETALGGVTAGQAAAAETETPAETAAE